MKKSFIETVGLVAVALLLVVLFFVIATLSMIVFKTNKWVYYGEDFD